MDKKVMRLYYVFIVLGLVCAVLFENMNEVQKEDRMTAQPAQVWAERMQLTELDGSFYYRTQLPKEELAGKVIGYDTGHMLLDVTIGGERVYSLGLKEGQRTKTTGYHWNFITLTGQDAGKEIVFRVTPAYKGSRPKGSFYFGAADEVQRLILKERLLRFVVTAAILVVGILLLVYLLLVEREAIKDSGLLNFTIFVIMLGTWLICETQIVELFLPWNLGLVYIDHVMLMTMPIPFLLFLRQMYQSKNHKLWNVYCYLNYFIISLRLLLQFIGLYDLRESLWMTHISIVLFVVMGLGFGVREIICHEITPQVKLNMCCVMVLMVSTVMELVQFRADHKGTPYGSLGFLFYCIVMGVFGLRKSRRLMRQARESAIYRKMAYTDGLTGLYNRAAFNRDIHDRAAAGGEETVPTALFMFDLNDLKKCNDNFGHEFGDRYITMFSGILKKIFKTEGTCYRLGGDEFCALISDTSQQTIHDIKEKLECFLSEENSKQFVVPVSVAVGCAVYKPDTDKSLDDTMKRADEMMYQNKQEIKKEQNETVL